MQGDQPISWLMFFTLAAGVVIVGFAFVHFIRSRSNRAVAADTLEGNGHGRGMAADARGNIYISGRTESKSFPVTNDSELNGT